MLANSFERIHRANLACMGILPLQLPEGWRPGTLGLCPGDMIDLAWDLGSLTPRCSIAISIRRQDGSRRAAEAVALLETAREVALVQAGGMIPTILARAMMP